MGTSFQGTLNVNDTAAYFGAQASKWGDKYVSRPNFRARLEIVSAWVGELGGKRRILDYGCGSGVMLRAFADAGHTVTGVDISADMLSRARQLLEAGAVPPDRFTLELVGEHF